MPEVNSTPFMESTASNNFEAVVNDSVVNHHKDTVENHHKDTVEKPLYTNPEDPSAPQEDGSGGDEETERFYTVTCTPSDHVTYNPNGGSFKEGSNVTILVNAEECYEITSLKRSGIEQPTKSEVVIENISGNSKIKAVANKLKFEVSVKYKLDGEDQPDQSVDQVVEYGDSYHITVDPLLKDNIESITVNDETLPELDGYIINNITENKLVIVNYRTQG